jgi:hypothetical protein
MRRAETFVNPAQRQVVGQFEGERYVIPVILLRSEFSQLRNSSSDILTASGGQELLTVP